MRRKMLESFAVVTVVAMLLLSNLTSAAAFNNIPLDKTENTRGLNNDSLDSLTFPAGDINLNSKSSAKDDASPFAFKGLWGLNDFAKNNFRGIDTSFSGVVNYNDHIVADGDSVQLIIGVDYTKSWAYKSVANAVADGQGRIVNTVSLKGMVIAVVADVPLNTVSSFIEQMSKNPFVRYVEPNMKRQALLEPNDINWTVQWGPKKIEANYAWNTTLGSSDIIVAVVDTGVDYTHPDLAGNYLALGYDWVNDDPYPLDDFGHGTHCAGIIAAVINNSIGIAGLAQVKIMAEKVLDDWGYGSDDWVANGIIHAADYGAKIISMSLGGYGYSKLLHEAVKYACDNGVLLVAAAGNDNVNLKSYPAAYEEVVAVSATNQNDLKAWFSNWGDWIELAAPGVRIYSTMPTYPVTLNNYGYSMNYSYMNGTSMACPHVAGTAALIWSRFASASRDWVRVQLRYTAEDLGDAGFDNYYGYGRINAKNSVEQAPPEHDLLIFDWDRPQYVKLGELTTFNVTVLNFGTSNETNVEVELLVNNSLIDSASISLLQETTSTTVSLLWTPTSEGTHNVTYHIVPVANEATIENNQISETIYVITPPSETNWMLLATDPNEDVGTNLKAIYGQVYSEIVYFKVEHYRSWTTIDDIDTAIFIDADQNSNTGLPDEYYPYQDTDIGADFVIVVGWEATEMWRWDPVYGWDIGNPIPLAYLEAPENSNAFVVGVFFVDLETSGIADFAVSDIPSNWDWMPNQGYFTWLLIQYEHELAVLLNTPQYLLPGETSLLNATVCNRGLNNETNVEIQLIINGSIVANETLPELVNGTCYTLNYSWTPSEEGIYNVTAYAPPVPEENFTLNNIKTKFVSVHYPLINPEPGQYANYIMNYYDSSGNLIGQQGYWNLTYEYYIEPYKVYITFWQKDPYGYISTGYMIVNTMNRFVEEGIWYGLWYPGWIETDIDIGSTINLLDGTATVSGTRMWAVGPRAIDCWEIPFSMYGYPYTFWYDKASGLWIGMNTTNPFTGEYIELFLIDTNVSIGVQYGHDLGVTLEALLRLQPGESSVLNATVYNLGLYNESNVVIQLIINGTVVKSETITKLVNGTSFIINYSWAPATEGVYNITAYAPPVSGEVVTINNVASVFVRVRAIQVALISYYSELMAITPILDSMGVGYDIYNDNYYHLYTEDLELLLKYKVVIFYNRYRWITPSEYLALESYLSSGGSLLVTGFDCLVSDSLLASLVRSSSMGDNVGEPDLIVVNDAHPIMNGPYGSFPQGYHIYGLFSDCDMAEADTRRGAITVAELFDGYDRIIATEGLPGKVVFWNGDGTYDWRYNSDCQAMLKNTIHWFLVRYQHELTVSLQAPKYLEPGDSAILNAAVRNGGLNDETNVELQLLINGTIVESQTIPLLQNGTSYTLSYLWTPKIAGKYNITVYAPPVPNENLTRNNIYSRIVPVQYAPKILAYVEYTDYLQEYQNTLRAIESTFGPNYELTELWDYTQLDKMLSGKDILLIPEQEYAGLYTMQSIGSAWAQTLSQFLERGGTIILCDFNGGYGGTYGILTGAGLMSISWANYRTWYTLYVVNPEDPTAQGVSPSFTAPDGTISFVTQEANVVVSDGTYHVVIHKKVGRGSIVLLGFDFYSSNRDTERILGNAVALAAYIIISINPSSGSPGTRVMVSGAKATANGTVSIYWDDVFIENVTANSIGEFQYELTVPIDATIGIHQIMAVDKSTGRTASAPFRVILITLNPTIGSVGTKVVINGSGFTLGAQARITFNDMLIGYALVDNFGNFTFTFNIPLSTTGAQLIKAYDVEGFAITTFTVIEIAQLDVQVDVGTIRFRGELVEFYVQTALKGHAIEATSLSAKLYGPDGELAYYQYPTNITAVAIGFYKIVYTIPADADVGTYALVVDAEYVSDTVQASGTSFKSFTISETLTTINAHITEIKNGIATIVIPDLGLIKLNLTAINATLDKIFIEVLAINGTVATLQTTLGTMNGTIVEIKNGIATIVVPRLGQIQTDVSSLIGTQKTWTIPQYLVMAFSIVAAAGAVLSAGLLLRQRKLAKTQT